MYIIPINLLGTQNASLHPATYTHTSVGGATVQQVTLKSITTQSLM